MQETTLVKKESRGRGRPLLEDGLRKSRSLRFRVSTSQMELLELASRLCDYRSRSEWAVSRLLWLATVVCKQSGIDPSNAAAVQKALEQIEKAD